MIFSFNRKIQPTLLHKSQHLCVSFPSNYTEFGLVTTIYTNYPFPTTKIQTTHLYNSLDTFRDSLYATRTDNSSEIERIQRMSVSGLRPSGIQETIHYHNGTIIISSFPPRRAGEMIH